MDFTTPWIFLIVYAVALLFFDFFVLHKKGSLPTTRKAIYETIFFVTNGLLFSILIYWFYNEQFVDNPTNITAETAVLNYLTGYIVELSLSVDNLFVIAAIFASFKIPLKSQHRLLFLGILGAIVFRAVLISVGLVLMEKIQGMTIVFGLFLLFTAIKMLKSDAEDDKEKDQTRGLSKIFRLTKIIDGEKFTTVVDGKKVFTALFGALITIEFTDLLFALDSIPAILSITTDPYIVYSSNIFAIMGLRSLYFFLSSMLDKFAYLKYSVFSILLFVSIKLICTQFFHIPAWFSLSFIALSLGIGIYISTININKVDSKKDN
jgi:tellurite resistance protein TerC